MRKRHFILNVDRTVNKGGTDLVSMAGTKINMQEDRMLSESI